MKAFLFVSCVLLMGIVRGQHLKSVSGHANNPYYSNTDTKHLDIANAEWKKILSPALYATARHWSAIF